MHIANYRGPLTFIEVTICGIIHIMQVLKLFSKFAVFTLKRVHVLEKLAHLGLVYTVFWPFLAISENVFEIRVVWHYYGFTY